MNSDNTRNEQGNKLAPLITFEQLKAIAPNLPKNADVFIPYLNKYMPLFGIDTPQRIRHFIAQTAHESGGFRFVKELSTGKQYEGRADLGNIHPGDGPLYKGRGLIQCTGRNNYMACSMALFGDARLLKSPELLEIPEYAVAASCWFWSMKGLNKFADLPDTWRSKTKNYSPLQYITYLVNGGQNGIADREAYYKRALSTLSTG
ncbi:glycoside hydrolase family 19 protein [Candidatus Dependentiae bacterium]|nr:glycoside hydrolase family 19 protein [Candidatus Dependentiae bacterium]